MRERGYETHVVCSDGELLHRFAEEEGATAHPLPMARRVTPLTDAGTIRALRSLLRRLAPHVVHAQTPKGGLLGTTASRAARVPRTLYHMRGLPVQGAAGVMRGVLWVTERVSCGLADVVICQSPSLRRRAIALGLVSADKSLVLGPGGNGVSTDRFDPNAARPRAAVLRAQLKIPETAPVVGFVGRLVRDKGIVELTMAWRSIRSRLTDAHLLIVGPFEPRDPVPRDIRRELERCTRVRLVGEQEDVAPYYALMSALALPSYREGFPNVPIEAGAMCVPVVATRIDGCVDAVVEGRTGTLVPVRDPAALADALTRYLSDPGLARRHGEAGRERALHELQPRVIHEALAAVYEDRFRAAQGDAQPWA
ncbi:MAG: glycosyltransferase family 4 protein [Sandaracinaceae bacterium]